MSEIGYTAALLRSPIAGPYLVSSIWDTFFRELYFRVGGANAPTITEINNIVVTAVVPDVDLVPRPEGVVSVGVEVAAALGALAPVASAVLMESVGLAPRVEVVAPNFDLSGGL